MHITMALQSFAPRSIVRAAPTRQCGIVREALAFDQKSVAQLIWENCHFPAAKQQTRCYFVDEMMILYGTI
ncbi:MAG: hypothetical protein H7335_11190 [Massilia sp.]|nr:hypothetical protein [Massilia sp.]